jgi:hypothetical protein
VRFAVEHVRRMRGGSQPHLMRCDDDSYYVVKFQNNPQGLRVLANEIFGTRLAALMGICVPEVDVVEVQSSLIEDTDELVMETPSGRCPCVAGKHLGSKYPGNPARTRVYEIMPDELFENVLNLNDFLGIFVFDKWVCQTDRRQAVFIQEAAPLGSSLAETTFRAMMIDQGFCFDGVNWNFPDAPLYSLYARRTVYRNVLGMGSFEPWLEVVESGVPLAALHQEAISVPQEWYGEEGEAWKRLIDRLDGRRRRVRELIWAARNAVPGAFPKWRRFAA